MACGLFPNLRHDDTEFAEEHRRISKGCALGLRGALLWVKADWAELVTTFGFPSWGDTQRPCPMCNAHKDNLHEFDDILPDSWPWRMNKEEDYDQACRRCEKWVTVDEAQKNDLISIMKYDVRPKGSRGRALQEDRPALGLRQNDRLTEEGGLRDIGATSGVRAYFE